MEHQNLSDRDMCPCGSGRASGACCGPYLSGKSHAPTPEALMRSRYAAYVTHNMDYVEATLLPETQKSFDKESARLWSNSSEWTGLEILSTKDGGANDAEGFVEFIAHFRQQGKDMQHYEHSRFVREKGQWYYVDSVRQEPRHAEKTGRNDACPCGSGKKYKKCCGK